MNFLNVNCWQFLSCQHFDFNIVNFYHFENRLLSNWDYFKFSPKMKILRWNSGLESQGQNPINFPKRWILNERMVFKWKNLHFGHLVIDFESDKWYRILEKVLEQKFQNASKIHSRRLKFPRIGTKYILEGWKWPKKVINSYIFSVLIQTSILNPYWKIYIVLNIYIILYIL